MAQATDSSDRQALPASAIEAGITHESFERAVRELSMFDCNRDDARFFLTGLVELLLGVSAEEYKL